MEIQGQWWEWRVLRCTLHVSTLRIRTKSGSAAQRRSRNFNLGSPKRPQRLGSTSTAAWSGQVFLLFDDICPGHLTSLDSEQFSCPRGGRTKRCIHLIVCGESHKWICKKTMVRDGHILPRLCVKAEERTKKKNSGVFWPSKGLTAHRIVWLGASDLFHNCLGRLPSMGFPYHHLLPFDFIRIWNKNHSAEFGKWKRSNSSFRRQLWILA